MILKPPFGAESEDDPTVEKHEDILTWSCEVTRPQALILLSCMHPEMVADMTRLLLTVRQGSDVSRTLKNSQELSTTLNEQPHSC